MGGVGASGGINFVKALLELIKSGIEFGGELTNVAKIELDRIFGTNGMDNDEIYKKALAKNAQELYYAGDNAYNIIKNIPKGIWEDIKTTGDINQVILRFRWSLPIRNTFSPSEP